MPTPKPRAAFNAGRLGMLLSWLLLIILVETPAHWSTAVYRYNNVVCVEVCWPLCNRALSKGYGAQQAGTISSCCVAFEPRPTDRDKVGITGMDDS